MPRRISVLGTVLVAAFTATPARAARRVLLAEFEGGKPAKPLRAEVKDVLEQRKVVVVGDRKLKLPFEGEAADLASAAEKHQADGVITGSLDKKKKTWVLHVALWVGGERSTITILLGRRPRLIKEAKVKLRKQLVALLAKLDAAAPAIVAPPPTVPEPEPEPPAVKPERESPTPAISGDSVLGRVRPLDPAVGRAPPVRAAVEDKAAPPKAKRRWDNFALLRPAMPGNRAYLRSYWDTRDYAALEGLVRVQAPLDFVIVGRTTLRRFLETMPEGVDQENPDTFGLDALFSPAVFGFGLASHVGSPLGVGGEAVRFGGHHTYMLKLTSWANLFFLTLFLPYDSTRNGGMAIENVTVTAGPVRGELVVAYTWPALRRMGEVDAEPAYLRPYLSLTLWKGIGVYAQYEYNAAVVEDQQRGLRLGLEVQGSF